MAVRLLSGDVIVGGAESNDESDEKEKLTTS